MINKICFFDFIYNLGGGQRSTIDLISNVSDQMKDIIIADAHGESKDFKEYALQRGISLVVINPSKNTAIGKKSKLSRLLLLLGYFPLYLKTALLLRKFIAREKIKFIWTNTFKGLIALTIATKFSKVSRGLFIRAGGMLDNVSLSQIWLLNNGVSQIMVQSNLIKQQLVNLGIDPKKISIISNSIGDLSSLTNGDSGDGMFLDRTGLNVLIPATIIPQKGIKEAIEAIKIFKGRFNVPIALYLAGKDGNFGKNTSPFLDELKTMINANDLDENVHFLGLRNDLIKIMNKMDIVLLPSYAEGMPRSIMEGMALGKAVIGTNVGAVPELIENGTNGIIIEPKSAEQIASALGVLIDVEQRNKLGKNAKEFIIASYSRSNQAKQFHSFLNNIS